MMADVSIFSTFHVTLYSEPAARPALLYNQFDNVARIDRSSYTGTYTVQDSLPLNPRGRTGLCGRGKLGRWGPNKAGDPIVTRWVLGTHLCIIMYMYNLSTV